MPPKFPIDHPDRIIPYANRTFVRIKDGKKLCPRCKIVHPVDEFHKSTPTAKNRHTIKTYCKKCASELVTDYRNSLDPKVRRERNNRAQLKWKFDLTVEKLLEMFVAQKSKCPICETDLVFEDYGTLTGWVVDHDHSQHPGKEYAAKSKPRGLLCKKCNMGLGSFNDNERYLEGAIKYLKDTK